MHYLQIRADAAPSVPRMRMNTEVPEAPPVSGRARDSLGRKGRDVVVTKLHHLRKYIETSQCFTRIQQNLKRAVVAADSVVAIQNVEH